MVQFGPVELIIMANWDWETQETETKQKRSKDFLKSKQLQEDFTMHCSLIMTDRFGPVDPMNMENWDWKTKETVKDQKKFQDFRKSNQLLEERTGQCLWTSKAMFGFVEEIGEENWGWVPTQEESTFHRKTRMFLELWLLEEDESFIQYFWTKQEIFILVETTNSDSLDWGTQQAGTFQRKSIISLQSPVFLVATQRLDFSDCGLGRKSVELWIQQVWAIGTRSHKSNIHIPEG